MAKRARSNRARRGQELTRIAPPGTFAHALYDARERTGLSRSELTARIERQREPGDPRCFPSNATMWEGGTRAVTEPVAQRYGKALGLVPFLEFVTPAEARRRQRALKRKLAERKRTGGSGGAGR